MDGIFGIGPLELFFVAIIALIVLGPERLPGALREVAKTIRRLREITSEFTSQFDEELKALDEINPRKILSDLTDPTKPMPGEKPSAAAITPSNVNKPVATPKPPAPKPQVTTNAIASSKAATEQARAAKAAKEAREAEAKAAGAKPAEVATNGASHEEPHSILPPKSESSSPTDAEEAPSQSADDTETASASPEPVAEAGAEVPLNVPESEPEAEPQPLDERA